VNLPGATSSFVERFDLRLLTSEQIAERASVVAGSTAIFSALRRRLRGGRLRDEITLRNITFCRLSRFFFDRESGSRTSRRDSRFAVHKSGLASRDSRLCAAMRGDCGVRKSHVISSNYKDSPRNPPVLFVQHIAKNALH
jgi:hypothetical protein